MATSAALRTAPQLMRMEIARTSRRSAATLPVLVQFLGRSHSASLRNLSQGGAMIETDARVYVGDEVDFRCGAIDTRAKVVWQAGKSLGLQFLRPVPEKAIREQLLRADYLAHRRNAKVALDA